MMIIDDPYLIFPDKKNRTKPFFLWSKSAALLGNRFQEEKRRQRSHGEHLWVVGKHIFFGDENWIKAIKWVNNGEVSIMLLYYCSCLTYVPSEPIE